MEDLGSMCDHGESVDELKRMLLYTTLKLIWAKNFTMELLNALELVYHERDEARDELHKYQNMLLPSSPIYLPNVFPQVQRQNSLLLPTKANSTITESNSHSNISSPVDPFLEAVSSPEFSNINVVDFNNVGCVNQPWVQNFNCSASPVLVSTEKPKSDPATGVIKSLVKGKALPQEGKLLQSVMEAGPLLQTLLDVGPLPIWRNPPHPQPIKVPPFTIKGFDAPSIERKPIADLGNYPDPEGLSRYALQTFSSNMLNFAGNPSRPWNNAVELTPNATFNDEIPETKRQRLY